MTIQALFTSIFEIIAAFSGFYFLRKNKESKLRYFVYFLVFTICIEAIASYTNLYGKIELLDVLKGSRFRSNYWLYNIYVIVSLFFYIFFYKKILKRETNKKILKALLLLSIAVVPFNIYIGGSDFFNTNLIFNFVWTTFSVFICVALFFYEMLMSDSILTFIRSTLFFISIGLLLWWLVFPPIALYLPFYEANYSQILSLRATMLISCNIYLYGCYIIGFLWGKEH